MVLSQKSLAKIKSKLETEVGKLSKEADRLKAYPNLGTSQEDNAEELEEFSGNVDLRKKVKKLLFESQQALKKIEKGTYGICENCKKEINPERLEAFPSALYCLDCEGKKPINWLKLFKR